MSRNSSRVAVCGLLAALSVIIMLISGYVGVLTYTAPMVAGGLLIVPVKEYGYSTAAVMYLAVALLGLMLCSDKELALFYLLLFGHYPIIQPLMDRIGIKAARRLLKAVVFNGCTLLAIWLAQVIFSIPIFDGESPVWVVALAMLAAVNLCFVLYDRALRQFYTIYDIKIRPMINKISRQ